MDPHSTTTKVSYPRVRQVLPQATDTEVRRIAFVLAEAFKDDPFTITLIGGNRSIFLREREAHVRAALIGGVIHVLELGPNEADIVGVAMWYPTGKKAFATEEERAAGFNQLVMDMPEWLQLWWTETCIPDMHKLHADNVGDDFALNAWQLHIFGVHPEYQGKGFGRKLMEFGEQLARKDNADLLLETTTELDVKIYTKLGFRICGETVIRGEVMGDTHMWLMVKELAKAGSA